MPTLAPEVWMEIACHLSPYELYRLRKLNRVFFSLAMEQRHGTADFNNPNFRQLVEKLQDPYIASCVRTIVIAPANIFRNLVQRIPSLPTPTPKSPPKPKKSLFSLKRLKRHEWARVRKDEAPPNIPPSAPVPKFIEEQHARFLTSISHCVALEKLELDWSTVRPADGWPNVPDPTLLSSILTIVPASLQRLRLDADLAQLFEILPDAVRLSSLAELHLNIVTPSGPLPALGHEKELSLLLSFINQQNLTTLSLAVTGHLDYDYLLKGLRISPNLVNLSLAMPFGTHTHPDPSNVETFINLHTQIRSLNVRHTLCCLLAPHSVHLHQCLSQVTLPQLTHLGLCVDVPENGILDRTNVILAQHIDQLTSLALTEQFLSLTFIKAVLAPFHLRGKLRTLTLTVAHLSPELIDYLAKDFTNLCALSIYAFKIVGTEDYTRPHEINLFRTAISWRSYNAWRLNDISIFKSAGYEPSGFFQVWDLVKCMKGCVPSIESYFGQGHLETPPSLRFALPT